VAFWHLGCASHARVADVCRRGATPVEAISYDNGTSWDTWVEPFKRRVCRVINADGTQTLEAIGEAHGVPRSNMYRFNEQIIGADLRGQTVYVP
jgi:hypothetical protein